MNLYGFGEAIRFLTILPVPSGATRANQEMAAALPWFPVVGLLIGVLLLPVGWVAGWCWGEFARAVVLVVTWAIITGGLHLDGVSDTFDAVMSWRPRERKLEIMKDSRVGALGVLALVAVLLLKVAWLSAAGEAWWVAVLLAPMWGRWAALVGIIWFPAARTDGLGRTAHGHMGRRALFFLTIGVLLVSEIIGHGHGVLTGIIVGGVTPILGYWWTRALGGLTGDTYGALCELGETVTLAALAAHRG